MQGQTIIYFTVKDAKNITFAEGALKEIGTTLITGDNGQGKSSLMQIIQAIIGGKRYLPELPVHTGAKKATGTIETQDYIANLVVPKKGAPRWAIKRKDGQEIEGTALQVFKELTGNNEMFFNLSHLFTLKGKEQIDYIKRLFGIDTDLLDHKYKDLYEERTNLNRQAKQKVAAAQLIKLNVELPDEETLLTSLMSEFKTQLDFNERLNKEKELVEARKFELEKKKQVEHEKKLLIKELEVKLESLRSEVSTLEKEYDKEDESIRKASLALINEEPFDISIIEHKIQQNEKINEQIREQQKRKGILKEAYQLQNKVDEITDQLQIVIDEKEKVLQAANLPAGLAFTEDGLYLNGVPFTEKSASSAEAIEIFARLAFQSLPKDGLRTVIIFDGGLCSDTTLKRIEEIAIKENGQLLIEKPETVKRKGAIHFVAGETS